MVSYLVPFGRPWTFPFPCIVLQCKVNIYSKSASVVLLLLSVFLVYFLCAFGFTHIHAKSVIHLKYHFIQYFRYLNQFKYISSI